MRLLIEDDREQTRRARSLVTRTAAGDEAVLVSLLVLLETEWVLRSRYDLSRATILGLFRSLLEAEVLSIEDESAVEEALFNWSESACGFSDCLIAARNRQLGCRATATFDVKAARLPGMRSI